MGLLNTEQQQRISQSIQAAESKTDAELVAVIARQSDDYRFIPILWAALLAMLVPAIISFSPLWLEAFEIFAVQALTFAGLSLLFSPASLRLKLIPKTVRDRRASNMACRQFLQNNLHHTKGASGVLIFISEAEHYAEIIADQGINQQVDQSQWQNIIDKLTQTIKAGNSEQALKQAIEECGDLLAKHFPATEEKNELPNHLVVL